jgi:hypothetical protein
MTNAFSERFLGTVASVIATEARPFGTPGWLLAFTAAGSAGRRKRKPAAFR